MNRTLPVATAVVMLLTALPLLASDLPQPWIDRVVPLGALRGTTVAVELHGRFLSNVTGVVFDSTDLRWVETKEASSGRVVGSIEVAKNAALGPHRLQLPSQDGPSNSRLFNVTQFPAVAETEPNDRLEQAQPIELTSQILDGYMKGRVDIDTYVFEARAGERWTFDMRSMEYGSYLECEMILFDAAGERVAFNDDRNDVDETPFLEHTFANSGRYYVQLDQYRGPQNVPCEQNCGYMLRISQLPLIRAASPLGAPRGTNPRMTLVGTALDSVESVYLTRVRGAEYYRMTYPFTMPISIGPDPQRSADLPRIDGEVLDRSADRLEARFAVPPDARTGLWRVWATGPKGAADGLSIEITDLREFEEANSDQADWRQGAVVVNGSLDSEGEEDTYRIEGVAGTPLRIWTLASQLGLPYIDTVLELFDSDNNLVAEHDDVMSGQGTVIGNPDSSLVYLPKQDGPLKLVVRDRIGRGGPTFQYRLKIESADPGFQLLAQPENFTVSRGESAKLSVLLIREPGFENGVEVWVEGLPHGVDVPSGKFRADQYFGPSADGDNIIIPQLIFPIEAPGSLKSGVYPFQIYGRAEPGGRVVQAHTSLWIGPVIKRNDHRRPMPQIAMNVIGPFEARLSTEEKSVRLEAGGLKEIKIAAKQIPDDARLRIANAPEGIDHRVVTREADQIVVELVAAENAEPGEAKVSVEAQVAGRWAATLPIALVISAPKEPQTTSR